jgi:hypothetical protein
MISGDSDRLTGFGLTRLMTELLEATGEGRQAYNYSSEYFRDDNALHLEYWSLGMTLSSVNLKMLAVIWIKHGYLDKARIL